MNTKIIIAATVAALSLATTAFAGEGQTRDQLIPPTPLIGAASETYGFGATVPGVQTGSQQYQGYTPGQVSVGFNNATLPENGQNGAVQTANSLPRGFEDGTPTYMEAQSVNHWFAMQAQHRFAQRQALLAAARRG